MSEIKVDGKPIDYDADNLLPKHMREGMKRYIEDRRPTGSFLTAVLSNDLMNTLRCADDINRHCLFNYAMWLHNYAPPECYGSPEKVRAWLYDGEGTE